MTGDHEGASVPPVNQKDKGKNVVSSDRILKDSTDKSYYNREEAESSNGQKDMGKSVVSSQEMLKDSSDDESDYNGEDSESSDSASDTGSEFEEEELAGLLEDAHHDIETSIKRSLDLPFPSSSSSSSKRHCKE
jgi:hypothetical protein